MKKLTAILTCAVALLAMWFSSCAHWQEVPNDEGRLYGQMAMAADYPAMLLKAQDSGKVRRMWHDADLDPIFYVPCRVLASYKLAPKPGDYVELAVPAANGAGKESSFADETLYWFVSGSAEDKQWLPVRRAEPPAGYDASALDFYGFDAEEHLLPARDRLRGIWRDMADMVAEKK